MSGTLVIQGDPAILWGTTDVSRWGTEDSVASRPQGCKSYLGLSLKDAKRFSSGQPGMKGGFVL